MRTYRSSGQVPSYGWWLALSLGLCLSGCGLRTLELPAKKITFNKEKAQYERTEPKPQAFFEVKCKPPLATSRMAKAYARPGKADFARGETYSCPPDPVKAKNKKDCKNDGGRTCEIREEAKTAPAQRLIGRTKNKHGTIVEVTYEKTN